MCGIAGLINGQSDVHAALGRMLVRMKDRGPNGNGEWMNEDRTVALGHCRLAIRDLSSNGAQPMTSHSGRYVMVYNGEIYNPEVLTKRLIADGFIESETSFRGTSDTEILLEAIEAYGMTKALQLSKGMFAIGLYDTKTGDLTLARDRVGEKPLYYGFLSGHTFAFASDVSCLREIDGFDNAINKKVLPLYFSHGYIPAPYTIYEDVYKLEPGTILTIKAPYTYFDPIANGDLAWFYNTDAADGASSSDATGNTDHSYSVFWSMKETARKGQANLFTGTEEEAADELERLILDAVKGQMVSDVPLGAFLSAGIDSSTIVSLMQAAAPGSVRTFTIGMRDEKFNEAVIAREIAGILGTQHTEMYIDDKDAKAVIPMIAGMFGEPFADSSQIPTYLVSKMTREHVTVSLSGDAGDELFAGYRSYDSVERIWGKMAGYPYPLRKSAGSILRHSPLVKKGLIRVKADLLRADSPAQLHMMEQDPAWYGERLTGCSNDALLYAGNTLKNYLKEVNHEAMLMDMTMYHPDDILVKVDRTAMAVSLETRVPLLDRDLVEFAWTLPKDYLKDEKVSKKVLRNVLYRYVPKELMDRPKKGFSIPIAKWLLEPDLREWAEDLLNPASIKEEGYLDPAVVEGLWRGLTEQGIWNPQIWYILMFEQWLRECGTKRK